MIIVKIKGGLGNQMFQYAFSLAMENQFKVKIEYDTSFYYSTNTGATIRRFELDKFGIQLKLSQEKKAEIVDPNYKSRFRLFQKKPYLLFNDQNYNYNDIEYFIKKGRSIYFDGYWQGELYFSTVENKVRNCFEFKDSIWDYKSTLIKEIQSSNAVSIHVRRGDYVSDRKTNLHHGVCPPEYFYKAINEISNKVDSPKYFIFSDDIKWVENNLILSDDYKIVKSVENPNSGINDMFAMTLCKHNIISNSTFSWWAAWLNNYRNKIVIAPIKWFNQDIKNIKSNTIIPKNWLRF